MKADSPALPGRVASLHLHPLEPGHPMRDAEFVEAVVGQGLQEDNRYFARASRATGQPSRRQVSLIEREQIEQHAAALGLPAIPPGAVRANIETVGARLVAMVGERIQIGDAVLLIYEARMPCEKMDRVCRGLRALMENQRQGVLAEVVRSGTIRVGDAIAAID